MKAPNTGGPAFPLSVTGLMSEANHGMSLRDWFAGMALQGMTARPGTVDSVSDHALRAYLFADAMIAVRKEPTP